MALPPRTRPTTASSAPTSDEIRTNALGLLRWVVAVALLCGLMYFAGDWAADRAVRAGAPAGGSAAATGLDLPTPDFRLPTLAGGFDGPGMVQGDVIVVEFWATLCGPCRIQAAYLEELYPRYADRGVRFYALNVGEPEDVVRRFAERSPFSYPVLLDPDETIASRYPVRGLPTIMVFAGAGAITYFEVGVTSVESIAREIAKAGVDAEPLPTA
ncbi:MAG: TlpA disulfide reductase family protein [Acidobacteriota bacterium]